MRGRAVTPAHYDRRMPRLWAATIAILLACLLASMVIAIVKLS
ncbi:MAG: hypothetical protein ACM33U_08305 [Solirubrobacterales bacterium]|jgi:hypothetical protein|nr:hypothetical protein [Solirubrobacterales bacterium]